MRDRASFGLRVAVVLCLAACPAAVPTISAVTFDGGGGCVANGIAFAPGAASPSTVCQMCAPEVDAGADAGGFVPIADGTACAENGGNLCVAGACVSRCAIGGVFVDAGAQAPSTACQICTPAVSASGYSASPDGTSCANDGGAVCVAGACLPGCVVDGGYFDAGEASPASLCQVCTPSLATGAFSAAATGTVCADNGGNVCVTGACLSGCFVADAGFFAAGASSPGSTCEQCNPTLSTTLFSPSANGLACADDGGVVCYGGACLFACLMDGGPATPLDAGALDAVNGCQACEPAVSTYSFTALPDLTSCATSGGNFCVGGMCAPGCVLDAGVDGGVFTAAWTYDGPDQASCCNPGVTTAARTPAYVEAFTFDAGPVSFGLQVAVADLNGDGYADVVALGQLGPIVFFGLPDGGLAPDAGYAGPALSMALGDINGDGYLDLGLVPAPPRPDAGVAILYGQAGGSFASSPSFTPNPPFDSSALGIGPVVPATNLVCVGGETTLNVVVYDTHASGDFDPLANITVPNSIGAVAIGHFYGVGGAGSDVAILDGTSLDFVTGFYTTIRQSTVAAPGQTALFDHLATIPGVSGGIDAVLFADSVVGVIQPLGDGGFAPPASVTLDGGAYATGIVAFLASDGGAPRVAIASDLTSLLAGPVVFPNGGPFLLTTFPASSEIHDIASGDVNGDGIMDLVTTGETTAFTQNVSVFLGQCR